MNTSDTNSKSEIFNKFSIFFAFSCILLGFYMWMAKNIPYTGDDWDWGLEIGMQHLLTADINSRYVGNFIEVCMTRSVLFKNIFLGVLYWLLPFCLCLSLKGLARWIGYIIANALIFCIPSSVWGQTMGWIAGAANYVTSAVFLVIWFYLVKPFVLQGDTDHSGKGKNAKLAGILCITFLMQMFIENLTIYIVGVTLFFVFYTKVAYKKWSLPCILICIASLLGAAIMFSGSMYDELYATGQSLEGYRKLATANTTGLEFLKECGRRFFFLEMMPGIWVKPWKITVIVSMAVALCVLISKKKGYQLGVLMQCVVTLVIFIFWRKGFTKDFLLLPYFDQQTCAGFSICFFIITGIQLLLQVECKRYTKFWLLGIWCSPCVLMMPMLFVNTLGPRNYFICEVVMLVFIMQLIEIIADKVKENEKKKICIKAYTGFKRCMAVGLVIAVVMLGNRIYHYGTIYEEIGAGYRERLQKIQECRQEDKIKLKLSPLPHKEYMWRPEPDDEDRVVYFKQFYKLPEKVQLKFN